MVQNILILYDLKGKSNTDRAKILKKMYGYRDKSNYNYSYERKGLLNSIKHEKSQKTVLRIKNKKDILKVTSLLKQLKVDFDLARK